MVAELKHAKARGIQMHPQREAAMRDRIWRSMRIMRRFTRGDLMATANASSSVTWRYLNALAKNGYVKAARVGPSHKMAYTLIADTGPLAPRPFSDGSIFDPNLIPR
jgi:hypothetical protein